MIPGSANPLLLKSAAAAAGGLQISRSLRFNSSDSGYLSRVPGTAGNRKTWTWSGWVKRSALGAQYDFASAGDSGDYVRIGGFDSSDRLNVRTDSAVVSLVTTQVFRDCSAWYHFVIAFDTTQATASNRVKFYVNGAQITVFTTATYPNQNTDWAVNNTGEHRIGAFRDKTDPTVYYPFSGYLANIHFIDGQQLTPSSFTETDATTGQLIPKTYTGSYGTNGFNLLFADNSSNTASTLGKDTSGLGNDWTPNNFSVAGNANYADYISRFTSGENKYNAFDGSISTYVSQDVADGTGITFAPSPTITVTSLLRFYHSTGDPSTKQYIINGGSAVTTPNSGWVSTSFTGTLSSFVLRDNRGAGYSASLFAIEVNGTILIDYRSVSGNDSLVDSPTNGSQSDTGVGGEVRGNYATLNPLQTASGATLTNGNLDVSTTSTSWQPSVTSIFQASGKWYAEFTVTTSTANSIHVGIVGPGFSFAAGNYIGVTATSYAYRADGGTKYNNATQLSYGASYTTGDVIGVAMDLDAGTLVFYKNGASQGTAYTGMTGEKAFAVSVGGTSGTHAGSWNFGQRAFAYTAPSGFKALNTANLPAPLVTKSNTVMDVALYTGNASTNTITGLAFSPDWVWIKSRSDANWHNLFDAVRGNNRILYTNATNAEEVEATASLTSFNSDGFTLSGNGSSGVGNVNGNGTTYVAWTWDAGTTTVSNTQGSITSQVRANATAGFSVVTYTGNRTAGATVGHGLGVAPQMIFIKSRAVTGFGWRTYHASVGNTKYLTLNSTDAAITFSGDWNNTTPGSSVLTLGADAGSGNYPTNDTTTFVAYCFAPVVGYSNFGSYVGNGSSTDGPFVYTGFRPKFVLIKNTSGASNWLIWDSTRGTYNANAPLLYPNLSNAEDSAGLVDFVSNGFKMRSSDLGLNTNGATYIYAAFAESPFNYSRAR